MRVILIWMVFVSAAASSWAAEVTLAWDMDVPVKQFKIYYGTIASRPSKTILTDGDVRQITITGLKAQTYYFFKATAIHLDGSESSFSNEVGKFVEATSPTGLKEAEQAEQAR